VQSERQSGRESEADMTATNRGAERVEHDNYPTPAWCVRRLLDVAPWDYQDELGDWRTPSCILEPCAGEGAIVRVLRDAYPRAYLCATDIREGVAPKLTQSGASWACDHVDAAEWGKRDGIAADLEITNPPFLLWHSIAVASLAWRKPMWLALLLRIGAAAHLSQEIDGKRVTLPTPSLYVLPNRPNFVASFKCKGTNEAGGTIAGCGWRMTLPITVALDECPRCGSKKLQRTTSDSSEYAWFVWGPQEPRVVVLADTPLAERKGESS
jgi:hypothetical protein